MSEDQNNDPTLRIEEIAMAKMIKAKAAEIGSPVADLSLAAIVKAHRVVMGKLGFKRKGE